jgi:sialate O-acetylesterase
LESKGRNKLIRLARIFQDGMCLQRNKDIRIWGRTDKVQSIKVFIDNELIIQGLEIKDDFTFVIPPQKERYNSTIKLKGIDELTLINVDIGEVWLAGGQSNMEFQLKYTKEFNSPQLNNTEEHLRYYDVGKYSFFEEESEGFKDSTGFNKWLNYNNKTKQYFSAIGYYFAKSLLYDLKVPIAIIGCNYGGTSILSWIKDDYFINNPIMFPLLEEYNKIINKLDIEKYNKNGVKSRKLISSKNVIQLTDNMMKGVSNFKDTMKGIIPSLKVIPYTLQMGPANPSRVSGLYHTMLEQIIGFSLRGVIWYQGESDFKLANIYDVLLSSLIENWRIDWKESLPFLIIQLAPFLKSQLGNGLQFPLIREKQASVASKIENVDLISIMDLGMKNDIHPKDKKFVGDYLGRKAIHWIYNGELDYGNPIYKTFEVCDNIIQISFSRCKTLIKKGEDISYISLKIDGKIIKKFNVQVKDNLLLVLSNRIKKESSIDFKFAYVPYCQVTIYNEEGFPVQPFCFDRH